MAVAILLTNTVTSQMFTIQQDTYWPQQRIVFRLNQLDFCMVNVPFLNDNIPKRHILSN